MSTTRTFFATAIHSGKIFAIGGRTNGESLNSAEYYEPGVNKWFPTAAMNTKRSYHQARVTNGCLIVYGGRSENDLALDSVEIYNPAENNWSLVILFNFLYHSMTPIQFLLPANSSLCLWFTFS